MWHRLFLLLVITLTASSIKVPVDKEESATEVLTAVQEEPKSTPVYYIKEDANVDSYLVPPDPHKPEEGSPEVFGTPATYLIPPTKEQQNNFYISSEPSAQSDWLPILQTQPQNPRIARFQRPPLESIPIFFNPAQSEGASISLPVPIPSTQLVPPAVDAVNEFFLPEVPEHTELHVDEHDQPIQVPNYNLPIYNDDANAPTVNPHHRPAEPQLALHLIPPKPQQVLKPPTKLYPKKYSGGFNPVPIPLSQFSEEKEPQIPKAKPAKYFKPQPNAEVGQFTPTDEKTLYHFKKAEHKRKLKGKESVKQHDSDAAAETYGEPTSTEQETSETNFRYPGRNVYPAPLRQPPPPTPQHDGSHVPASDGRTEFRMHGMKGPHSYQFGYDTGKGKNRQFRYEERDNDGLVHGHYGYVDRSGKLRVVNYSAHPEYGFRAEEPVEKEV